MVGQTTRACYRHWWSWFWSGRARTLRLDAIPAGPHRPFVDSDGNGNRDAGPSRAGLAHDQDKVATETPWTYHGLDFIQELEVRGTLARFVHQLLCLSLAIVFPAKLRNAKRHFLFYGCRDLGRDHGDLGSGSYLPWVGHGPPGRRQYLRPCVLGCQHCLLCFGAFCQECRASFPFCHHLRCFWGFVFFESGRDTFWGAGWADLFSI